MRTAIVQGDITVLQQFYSNHIINLRFNNALTPMHVAIMHNQPAVVEFLLSTLIIDLSDRDSSGRTALGWAYVCSNATIFTLLLENIRLQFIQARAIVQFETRSKRVMKVMNLIL